MIWNIYRSWKVVGFFNFDIDIVWNTSTLSESVKGLCFTGSLSLRRKFKDLQKLSISKDLCRQYNTPNLHEHKFIKVSLKM